MSEPLPGPSTTPPAVSRSPRGMKLAFVIGGAALAALLLTLGIVYAVIASERTPDLAAIEFLDAVVAGDAAAAADRLAGLGAAPLGMLSDEVLAAATDSVTDYEILGTTTDRDTATVTVRFTQGDESYESDLLLTRTVRDLGLFDVWRMDAAALPTVYLSYVRPDGMGLSVGGVELESGTFEYDVPALPGTYTFEPTGTTEFVTAEPVTVTLRFGSTEPNTVAMPVILTEAGVAAAQAAVDATLDACLAQAVLDPAPNCGFATTADGSTLTNIRWTLLVRPTVTFGDYRLDGGWAVISESGGSMRMDADFTEGDESGTAESVVENVVQSGTITSITDDGVATFESVSYE